MPECAKCGKEFDSERGLKVHNSQVHEEDPEVLETKKEANVGNMTLRLNYRHALVLTFAVGVLAGGFFTSMMFSVGGMTGMMAFGDLADADVNTAGSNADTPTDTQDDTDDNNDAAGNSDTVDTSKISLEGEPILGDPDAPVTVVSYEDFFCPYCGRFANNVVPEIVSDYVESGDVKIVYKHMPVVGGDKPALAAACVAEQDHDAFWDYKDALFENQNQYKALARNEEQLQEELTSLAGEVGVDTDQFTTCYENEEAMDQVQDDFEEGRAIGARGTPTIVVGDEMVRGAQPYQVFQSLIEEQLSS